MEERLARLEDAIGQIIEAVKMVCEKQSAMDEELDRLLSSKVYDRLDGIESEFGDLVGGFNDIIDGRRKREYSENVRERYGEKLRPFEGFGKEIGIDVFDEVANKSYDAPEESRESVIGEMITELESRFGKIIKAMEAYDAHNQHEAAETPEQEAAEHKPAVEVEIESTEGVNPKVLEMARRFKQRAG